MVHRFQIVGEDGSQPDGPTWSWDGNLEAPTFSPSMLVYESADVCPPDYEHYRPCDDPDCAEAHALIDDVPSHFKGHVGPRGNCHSFLKNGQWEFLSDSAHKLAGQTVPMVPLPDWLVRCPSTRLPLVARLSSPATILP